MAAQLANVIILLATFIALLVLVGTQKMERSVLALVAALITYVVLVFGEGANPEVFTIFLFGSAVDGYTNLHSILLILSMLIIVEVAKEGGLFQFLAFKLVQMTRGQPKRLMVIFCVLTVFITAILGDILTVIVLLPLTITVCRILDINPRPYLMVQIMICKVGAIMFLISSVANIVISGTVGITFIEFFLNIGSVALVLLVVSIIYFMLVFHARFETPKRGIDLLMEYNAWIFVPDRSLMIKSIVTIFAVMVGFVAIPANVLPPDMIAFAAMVVLLVISRIDPVELFKKTDFKLLIYLMGIFVITGGMEYVGIIEFLATSIGSLQLGSPFAYFLLLVWIAGYLSGPVDNIAIMRVLIPIASHITQGWDPADAHLAFYGVTFGINLGDNLTPFGDSMLGINIAQENKCPLSIKEFFLVGFVLTNIQFLTICVVFSLKYEILLGLLLLGLEILIFVAMGFITKQLTDKKPTQGPETGKASRSSQLRDD